MDEASILNTRERPCRSTVIDADLGFVVLTSGINDALRLLARDSSPTSMISVELIARLTI